MINTFCKHARARVEFVLLLVLVLAVAMFKFFTPQMEVEPVLAKPSCDKFIIKEKGMVTFNTDGGINLRVPEQELQGDFSIPNALKKPSCTLNSLIFNYYWLDGELYAKKPTKGTSYLVSVYIRFSRELGVINSNNTERWRFENKKTLPDYGVTYYPNLKISSKPKKRASTERQNLYVYILNDSKSISTGKPFYLYCSVNLADVTSSAYKLHYGYNQCSGAVYPLAGSMAEIIFNSEIITDIKSLFEKIDAKINTYYLSGNQ